ncbi:unnamed protein product [Polarella glacialis]|uniref:Uncharacterized protein n=1 Tax=Polarella glacialis TaxID=89957 RepID=A0A813J6Y4_POLGL|nr:unnamed protein product [Polarella glacialis]
MQTGLQFPRRCGRLDDWHGPDATWMPLSCRCLPMSTLVPMSCAEHSGAAEKRSPSCARLEESQAVCSGSCSYSDVRSYSNVHQLQCLLRAARSKGFPTPPNTASINSNCA